MLQHMTRLGTVLLLLFVACVSIANPEKLLSVKYRSTPVDVDKSYFESLDTSKSSFIQGAWYDEKHHYMIINLSGANYHYCGLDAGTWKIFKASSSFGTA